MHQESREAEADSARGEGGSEIYQQRRERALCYGETMAVIKYKITSCHGIMVLAGDTLPIEVYCHLPVMCEDRNLPYVYIPSKTDLGAAAGSKRPTCVIMVKPHEEYQEAYDECLEEVQALPPPM
ncbi:H/ACA ribonucleoprotein complex subunit 2 isoform X2 [Cervus elaphus]|uniref:H/ACA ribonucleoprotein complex subunit 2 isoform X2 n=1 Tax=Cervus canadensis TaxID=1574408 RepID=UPI001C9E32DA|nr:H/ACA ribonucleoprotein complex subunit 2 isoform X2 [Cervus canadensis]XP_043768370.1 H/ACA ribonucleoprotein complex subunit 2 isoform X2 [Cervus elaphus]